MKNNKIREIYACVCSFLVAICGGFLVIFCNIFKCHATFGILCVISRFRFIDFFPPCLLVPPT